MGRHGCQICCSSRFRPISRCNRTNVPFFYYPGPILAYGVMNLGKCDVHDHPNMVGVTQGVDDTPAYKLHPNKESIYVEAVNHWKWGWGACMDNGG